MNNVEVVTMATADQRFGVMELFHLDGSEDDEEILVFTGDTRLENLPLDFTVLDASAAVPAELQHTLSGVVVDGDLTVEDWIINWELDFGPFLLVRGDVRAKNVATAGSEVLITGNLDVAQTLAGIYNHGQIVVKGDTRAQVVFTNEHLIEFHGAVTAEFAWAGNFFTVMDPARLNLGGHVGHLYGPDEDFLTDPAAPDPTRSLRGIDLAFRDFDRREIMAAIKAGRSLLRGQPAASAPLDTLTEIDRVRAVLLRAGHRESDPSGSGFSVRPAIHVKGFEVEFDECAEDEPSGREAATELPRYADTLRAAGYELDDDYPSEDEEVVLVLDRG
jgi:hypothetical protein